MRRRFLDFQQSDDFFERVQATRLGTSGQVRVEGCVLVWKRWHFQRICRQVQGKVDFRRSLLIPCKCLKLSLGSLGFEVQGVCASWP